MGITTCAFFKNTAMQVKAVTVVHFSAFYTYIYKLLLSVYNFEVNIVTFAYACR